MSRPCLGCGRLIESGSRCIECQPKRKPRDTAHAGTDRRWRTLSNRLRKASPFCEIPGCTSADLTTDHILPVSVFPELAYEELNCRVICRSHNGRRGSNYTDEEHKRVLDAIEARRERQRRFALNQLQESQ